MQKSITRVFCLAIPKKCKILKNPSFLLLFTVKQYCYYRYCIVIIVIVKQVQKIVFISVLRKFDQNIRFPYYKLNRIHLVYNAVDVRRKEQYSITKQFRTFPSQGEEEITGHEKNNKTSQNNIGVMPVKFSKGLESTLSNLLQIFTKGLFL